MTEHDPVKAPAYYLFPNDVQLRAITSHLTGNGAQGVQYIARATRLDGNNKGAGIEDQIQDLEKAVEFVVEEIRRLRQLQADRHIRFEGVATVYRGPVTYTAADNLSSAGQTRDMGPRPKVSRGHFDTRVHNHDFDPSCPEDRDADGFLRGECMRGE